MKFIGLVLLANRSFNGANHYNRMKNTIKKITVKYLLARLNHFFAQ